MPTNETKTPRTDAEYFMAMPFQQVIGQPSLEVVKYDFARQLELETIQLRQELNKLKPDLTRSYFGACPNCEPVMCCNGQECGCMGMPVDFTPTDKCDNFCLLRVYKEVNNLKRQLTSLQADKEMVLLAVDNFLAEGRPHGGRNTQYPNCCECDLCENWDRLNRERQAIDSANTKGE